MPSGAVWTVTPVVSGEMFTPIGPTWGWTGRSRDRPIEFVVVQAGCPVVRSQLPVFGLAGLPLRIAPVPGPPAPTARHRTQGCPLFPVMNVSELSWASVADAPVDRSSVPTAAAL